MTQVSVDINKDASVDGLFEELDGYAKRRATSVSKVAAKIYVYAISHPEKFRPPLTKPRSNPGKFISAKVSQNIRDDLKRWAEAQDSTRNKWCCFLLQKALEDSLVEQILDGK